MNIETNKDSLNNNNKEEKKYKIVYSPYGYIKISEEDINNNSLTIYKFVQYKNSNNDNDNNCMLGTIFKNNIKQNINIKVKYFSGNRKMVLFENIDINSKLNILIEKLFLDEKNNKQENFNDKKYTKNTQHRLYSCKKGLRELNTGITIYENQLEDNEILIYFVEVPLYFSSTMKGKSIELSQMGKTALKISTDDPQYILGSYGYISGRHYFEINLLTDPMIRSVVVGFCNKKNQNNLFSTDIQKFYGFILSDLKKTIVSFEDGDQEEMSDYGEMCNINDKIGVLFDCRDDFVYISFYRNKKDLGIAFKLPKNVIYFPTVEMGLCGSKIQIYNDVDFPNE